MGVLLPVTRGDAAERQALRLAKTTRVQSRGAPDGACERQAPWHERSGCASLAPRPWPWNYRSVRSGACWQQPNAGRRRAWQTTGAWRSGACGAAKRLRRAHWQTIEAWRSGACGAAKRERARRCELSKRGAKWQSAQTKRWVAAARATLSDACAVAHEATAERKRCDLANVQSVAQMAHVAQPNGGVCLANLQSVMQFVCP